jgi:hypothetical protein
MLEISSGKYTRSKSSQVANWPQPECPGGPELVCISCDRLMYWECDMDYVTCLNCSSKPVPIHISPEWRALMKEVRHAS